MSGQLPEKCEDGVGWWDAVDVIGVDAYFVLNATFQSLYAFFLGIVSKKLHALGFLGG